MLRTPYIFGVTTNVSRVKSLGLVTEVIREVIGVKVPHMSFIELNTYPLNYNGIIDFSLLQKSCVRRNEVHVELL